MTKPKPKRFDCVQSMREVRDRISREIQNMSHEELAGWLRSHRFSEPLLQRLADKAARQARAEVASSPRR
jgi:hypothetical protein